MRPMVAMASLLCAAGVAAAPAPALKGDDAAWLALFKPAAAARAAAASGITLSPYAPRGARPKPTDIGGYDGAAYLATGALPGGGTLIVSGDSAATIGTIAFTLQATGPAAQQKAQFVAAARKFFAAANVRQPGLATPVNEAAADGFAGNGNYNVPTGTSVTRLPNGARRIAIYYGTPTLPPTG